MSLTERVQKDMVAAMRGKEELRLSTLRMMKAALQNKRLDLRLDRDTNLEEKDELQVLSTMIKQHKDSIEQFTKGNRPELAQKEAEEIVIIEGYMPKAVGEEDIVATVRAVIAEMGSPTMKDMGAVMKNAKAKFGDARVDGKILSEAVKKQLAAGD
ncbi:MAG: GatB/YqeY domain-containing protein [Candidatus Korobacteraceae bacterium]